MAFKELRLGTLFNIKAARYIKVTNTTAVVIISSLYKVGSIQEILPDLSVVKLYADYND